MKNRSRTWISYGVAAKATTNRAGRQIDANDEIVSREAQALQAARRLAPARTRRYEDTTGADILRELIHGR